MKIWISRTTGLFDLKEMFAPVDACKGNSLMRIRGNSKNIMITELVNLVRAERSIKSSLSEMGFTGLVKNSEIPRTRPNPNRTGKAFSCRSTKDLMTISLANKDLKREFSLDVTSP